GRTTCLSVPLAACCSAISAAARASPPVRAYGHSSAVTWRTRVFNAPSLLQWWIAGSRFAGRSGNVVLRDVRLEHPARGEAFNRHGQRPFHHMYPLRRVLAREPVVIHRHDFLFEQAKEMLHVALVGVTVLPPPPPPPPRLTR